MSAISATPDPDTVGTRSASGDATDATSLLGTVKSLVRSELAPIASVIDRQGRYPVEFLHHLADIGAFAAGTPAAHGGLGLGQGAQIDIINEVGRECGSTARLVGSLSTFGRYRVAS